jgi:single-strand DNA-binding protein
MQNINRVILTANLTRDPEMKTTAGSVAVCTLRVACNSRVKRDGEWTEKPNYFDVTCFGAQAENVSRYLTKGRGVAIDGRLDWREWTTDGGDKRQAVQIIADSIQFLQDGQRDGDSGSQGAPPATSAPSSAADDDIPF